MYRIILIKIKKLFFFVEFSGPFWYNEGIKKIDCKGLRKMKKSAWFLLWFCVFCMAFSLPYSAESFVDDCSSDLSTLTRETYNLVDADGYFQSFPSKPVEDTTALSIRDYKEYGEIVYSIEDVQEVTVSAYRIGYPSFVVRYPNGELAYKVMPDETEGGEMLPLWLDETTDYVYCIVDDQYFLLYGDHLGKVSAPENELVPYGIDIQQSPDGERFESVEVDRAEVTMYSDEYVNIFDESFSASIAPDSKYIKVRLKQFSCYPIPGSPDGSLESRANLAMIHEVTCEGEGSNLNPGGGAQLPEGEEPSSEDDTQGGSGSSSGSKKAGDLSLSAERSDSTSTSSSSTTSTSTTESSSTSTSDSNNTTTTNNYTSNYFIIDSSPEAQAILKKALGIEAEEEAKTPEETEEIASGNLGESSQADLGSTAQTTVTEEVLYQDEPAIDSSYDAIAPVAQQLQGSTEQEDWKLYLLILLASAVVVLEVVRIIRIRGTQKDEPDDNDGSI